MSYVKKTWANGDIVSADQVNKWETGLANLDSNIQAILGTNNNQIVTTYDADGRLTKVEETDGTITLSSSTLAYDSNGSLTTVTELVNGITTVSTFNYQNGVLTSISRATS